MLTFLDRASSIVVTGVTREESIGKDHVMVDLEIVVYDEKCSRSGACRRHAPTVFGADQTGAVTLLRPNPSKDLLGDLVEAHDACPSRAIEVLDDGWERLA